MVIGKATYSPQDDKIRIYFNQRIDKALWEQFKEKGFTWTMKQESDLVATWRPSREDFAVLHCGELEDETGDMLDRSADRAERFNDYLENRIADTEKNLDNVSAIGMESKDKAKKIADRVERMRDKSNLNYSKAKYWQSRIDSVIKHAIFKESASLRKRRIRTLQTEFRKFEKQIDTYKYKLERYKAMSSNEFIKANVRFRDGSTPNQTETIARIEDLLINSNDARWYEHLKFRLEFENKVLESQGYKKLEANYKIGGYVNGYQIIRINKTNKQINSFTVENKYKKRDYEPDQACILIENVTNYTPPPADFKKTKKETLSVLNLSPSKLKEIFKDEIEVLEMTSTEWKQKSDWSDAYGFEFVKQGKILGRYRNHKKEAEYKLRSLYKSPFFNSSSDKQKLIVLTDKKFNDDKVKELINVQN